MKTSKQFIWTALFKR